MPKGIGQQLDVKPEVTAHIEDGTQLAHQQSLWCRCPGRGIVTESSHGGQFAFINRDHHGGKRSQRRGLLAQTALGEGRLHLLEEMAKGVQAQREQALAYRLPRDGGHRGKGAEPGPVAADGPGQPDRSWRMVWSKQASSKWGSSTVGGRPRPETASLEEAAGTSSSCSKEIMLENSAGVAVVTVGSDAV